MENLNNKEILFKSNVNINFQIDPKEYGINMTPRKKEGITLESFHDVCEIYKEALAPTLVCAGTRPSSGEKVAIKKIYKNNLVTEFQKRQAAQEFPLHCSLDHENIVKGLEWSENDLEYIMIMEYMNNAEYLKEKIDVKNLNPIKNEIKMKSFVNDMLEGLSYLHNRGIVHGDIKLENCLLNRYEDDGIPILKLCDFGLSRFIDKSTHKFLMETPVGSMTYMAPEIKANSLCDEAIDLWAVGICLYKMCVAYKPTQIGGYKYGSGPIPFRKVDWKKRSPELQDLITKLLEFDPKKRITVQDAMQHPWFQI